MTTRHYNPSNPSPVVIFTGSDSDVTAKAVAFALEEYLGLEVLLLCTGDHQVAYQGDRISTLPLTLVDTVDDVSDLLGTSRRFGHGYHTVHFPKPLPTLYHQSPSSRTWLRRFLELKQFDIVILQHPEPNIGWVRDAKLFSHVHYHVDAHPGFLHLGRELHTPSKFMDEASYPLSFAGDDASAAHYEQLGRAMAIAHHVHHAWRVRRIPSQNWENTLFEGVKRGPMPLAAMDCGPRERFGCRTRALYCGTYDQKVKGEKAFFLESDDSKNVLRMWYVASDGRTYQGEYTRQAGATIQETLKTFLDDPAAAYRLKKEEIDIFLT